MYNLKLKIKFANNINIKVNPTIHVVYNGSHYDSYTHTPVQGVAGLPGQSPAPSALARNIPKPGARLGISLPSLRPVHVNISSENVGKQHAILKNIENKKNAQWKCGMCTSMNPSNKARCEVCDFNREGGRRKTRRSKKRQLKRKTKRAHLN